MKTFVLALALVAVAVAPTHAENPFACAPGSVEQLMLLPTKNRLIFRGSFALPTSFDPVAHGFRLDVLYEPEAAGAGPAFSATIGPNRFKRTAHGFLFHDRAGNAASGGITGVSIQPGRAGSSRVVIHHSGGTPLSGIAHTGVLRVVLSAGPDCARTCGSACSAQTARTTCAPSTDTALCGVKSGCELLNVAGGSCLLPYPSAFFESADGTTPTGKRLAYPAEALPANAGGKHIDPTAWNILDGYSSGPIATVDFPQGVDVAASHLPPLTDFAQSLDAANSPTILLDADTGQLVEHFAEVDVSIAPNNLPVAPPSQVLMMRPGRRLRNGGHYIVAMRGLVDPNGHPIAAEPAFAALRDGTPSGSAAIEARRAHFESLFSQLATAGVSRGTLVLAWDFDVASDDAIERWLVSMRDQAFAGLGPNHAPAFQVTKVEDDPFGDPKVCRRVQGVYTVPLFTTFDGPGSLLVVDPQTNLPVQNGVATDIPFTSIIPCSLVNPTPHAGRPIFYGHGLLGTGFGEVSAGNLRTLANTYGFVITATDWQGFANTDLGTIAGFIGDFSNFRKLPERLHQGILNQLLLGRLLGAPDGLSSDPAFQFGDGMGHMVSVIDPSEVFYYGNSQGGILGGVVMALAQETTRGVLGVAAANFSTLLQRSVDFEPFFALLRGSYPDDVNRALVYPVIQQLWDRAEPNGYYHHTVSNPLANTPAHKVLVHMSFGDAEVANIGTEIMVRSMGIPQVTPVLQHFFQIPEMAAPFDGSAMQEANVGGIPAPPTTNVPPANNGAHGGMRALPAIQMQIDRFLRTGGDVESFCAGTCGPPLP